MELWQATFLAPAFGESIDLCHVPTSTFGAEFIRPFLSHFQPCSRSLVLLRPCCLPPFGGAYCNLLLCVLTPSLKHTIPMPTGPSVPFLFLFQQTDRSWCWWLQWNLFLRTGMSLFQTCLSPQSSLTLHPM